jgi:hypothetical protein
MKIEVINVNKHVEAYGRYYELRRTVHDINISVNGRELLIKNAHEFDPATYVSEFTKVFDNDTEVKFSRKTCKLVNANIHLYFTELETNIETI